MKKRFKITLIITFFISLYFIIPRIPFIGPIHRGIFYEKQGYLYTDGEFFYGVDCSNFSNFYCRLKNVDEISDPSTLEYLGYDTYKDKNNIYKEENIYGDMGDFSIWIVADIDDIYDEEVDTASFEYVGGNYFKDKNYVYRIEHKYKKRFLYLDDRHLDSSSFEYLWGNYAIDKNGVYYNSALIEGADPTTFLVIKEGEEDIFHKSSSKMYAKDANYVYWNGYMIEGADPQSFRKVTRDVPFNFEDDLYYYSRPWSGTKPLRSKQKLK